MSEPIVPTRPFSSSTQARDFLICLLASTGFMMVAHVPLGILPPLQQYVLAFLIALAVYAIARLLSWLLRPWLVRSKGIQQKALAVGILAVAGPAGYVLGGLTDLFLRERRLGLPMLFPMLLTAGVSLLLALSVATYDSQKNRLAESVARLKEAEFAERELHLARGLQSRLLPPPEIEGEGYRIAARNLPARVVAGDFYDVFPLAGGALGVVVADVAGKGMAASLIMASVKAMLPLVAAGRTPEETLRELNRRLAAELSPREFVALAYARFDPAAGTLALSNAGLPDPYLLPLSGPAQAVAVPGPRLPLGVRREVEYRSQDLTLAPGERLLFLTDGLAEAPTADGEPLGYAAFAELLDGASSAPAVWLDGLLDRVRAATKPGLEDDWTTLVLERVERAAP